MQTPDGQPSTTYGYTQQRFDGYKEASVGGSRYSGGNNGTSTYAQTSDWYDVNGQLAAITDSTDAAKNRTFVNDAAGRALFVNQNGQVQRQLIVAGEVLGRVGMEASGAAVADFNFGYRPIDDL